MILKDVTNVDNIGVYWAGILNNYPLRLEDFRIVSNGLYYGVEQRLLFRSGFLWLKKRHKWVTVFRSESRALFETIEVARASISYTVQASQPYVPVP